MKLIFLAFVVLFFLTSAAFTEEAAVYGQRQTYAKGLTLRYPEFIIQFKERRQQEVTTSEGHKIPFGPMYIFEVTGKNKTQRIPWSSGTGDLSPTYFKVGDKCFSLELKYSDGLGSLEENELVVEEAVAGPCAQ